MRHYSTLASHPAVTSVTYWGLTDDGAWLGAPGGLVRADGTPKPAYEALRRLVKDDWWLAPTSLRTDARGRARVVGWLGDYDVAAAGAAATFALTGDDVVVRLA